MFELAITEDPRLAPLCAKWHVRSLALFGSALRDDFGAHSDIDILVEFEPNKTPGLDFFALQDELSDIFGRRVDLSTPKCLSPHFRNEVIREARPIYVKP